VEPFNLFCHQCRIISGCHCEVTTKGSRGSFWGSQIPELNGMGTLLDHRFLGFLPIGRLYIHRSDRIDQEVHFIAMGQRIFHGVEHTIVRRKPSHEQPIHPRTF